MTQPSTPAGWYDDPHLGAQLRYWDGTAWTGHTSPKESPPPETSSPPSTTVLPVGAVSPAKRNFVQRAAAAQKAQQAAIICPHCQVAGKVKTRPVRRKQGISGGKATGAVLTLGVSMLATGLSRKQSFTEMRCGNCGVKWLV